VTSVPTSPSDIRLADYDVIFVNSSGGKDSQAMTDWICDLAQVEERHFGWEPGEITRRIVLAHAALGRVEWPGTEELVEEHAKHYGVRFEKISRPQGDLIDHIRQRGMWPSSTTRYCTSDHKRGQCSKIITQLTREVQEECGNRKVKIHFLNCFGFRSEESPRRAKLSSHSLNKRLSNTKRVVHDWLPIQDWTLGQVWGRIQHAGTRHHWAYDRGMTRLSCRFCIFAPRSQLMLAATQPENAELWQEYLELEEEIDHTFRAKQSLREIQDAIDGGETPTEDDGAWNM
jgi:3'-phosphoadenosine 5'-phosphosulfate sulfotransferase (PAPS reductase)/FAD synthetase